MKRSCCFIVALLVLCAGFMGITASAAASQKLEVAFYDETTPLSGARLYLYAIGDFSDGEITPDSPFDDYSVSYTVADAEDMKTLALTLSGYILRDDLKPTYTDITDENGLADFSGEYLEDGVYILMADKHRQDDTTYFCEPVLIMLPYGEDDTLTVIPKFSEVPDDTKTVTVSYKVLKAWVNDNGTERPVEIVVDLLKDGEVYDTVKLDESNNWRYQWDNLSVFHHWIVVERWVSEGYKVSLAQDGKTLLLSNSGEGYEEPTTTPDSTDPQKPTKPNDDEPELPATGTLQWPIPYLAVAGLLLITLGYVKYRKSETADE